MKKFPLVEKAVIASCVVKHEFIFTAVAKTKIK